MSTLTDFFTSLANKIRSKTGSSATMTPSEMIDAIDDIATPLQTKTANAGTSVVIVTPDTGYALSSVNVNPTPTQSKSATPSTSAQTISPDSGYFLSSVTVNAISPNRTSNSMIVPRWGTNSGSNVPATRVATLNPRVDFGNNTTYGNAEMVEVAMPQGYYAWSYGNSSCCIPTETKSVTATTSAQTVTPTGYNSGSNYVKYLKSVTVNPQSHSATYTFPANDTGGTKDLGTAHNYRYVNAANVYAKGKADGKSVASVPSPNVVTSLQSNTYANLTFNATPKVGDIVVIFSYGSSQDVTMNATSNITQKIKTTAIFGSRCPLIVGQVKTVPSSKPTYASSYVSCSGG